MIDALVIGAGPAGLMAAEQLAEAGLKVLVTEAKPSPARKFLMAGKSGLNITKNEEPAAFRAAFHPKGALEAALTAFGPREVIAWVEGLGRRVFTGSTGRVFPEEMKASPLLRAWLGRLEARGVQLKTQWRWTGHDAATGFAFTTPEGPRHIQPKVTVLALGGASWARLGSDGAWAETLATKGAAIRPFAPANMGLDIAWSAHMAKHFGQPIKGAHLRAGALHSQGEFVISARGLEGGGLYAVSRGWRDGARLEIDLMPKRTPADLGAKWAQMRAGESLANRLRKIGLSGPAAALVMEWGRDSPLTTIKALSPPIATSRPLDEAISVAGGVRFDALSPDFEITAWPNVFACGEMLDWEAPTGGYLLTGCLASGRWAGQAAARRATAR